MQILITGCNGTLGKFLYNHIDSINNTIVPNTRDQCDLSVYDEIERIYGSTKFDVVVHCAAYTDVKRSDTEKQKVFNDNILASINLIRLSMKQNSRFIFISTDFVFDGTKGFYEIHDLINPQTTYAKSKAAIEFALSCYTNSLVIRTSFFDENFPFDKACLDRFTSKDYIDIIGSMIANEIIGTKTGIIHIGTERKSFYDLANRRKKVDPIYCLENSNIGKDHSLIC